MPRYLLDTNILTDLESPNTPEYLHIMNKLASLPEESEVGFSIISAFEYHHGIAKASSHLALKLKKAWLTFLELFDVFPLSLEGAIAYGEIKRLYEVHTGIKKQEVKRHTVDFILAGTAVTINAIVVSDDKIFLNIMDVFPSLQVENWKNPQSKL